MRILSGLGLGTFIFEYWRFTPTNLLPLFKKPVSYMMTTASTSPRCSTTYPLRSSSPDQRQPPIAYSQRSYTQAPTADRVDDAGLGDSAVGGDTVAADTSTW